MIQHKIKLRPDEIRDFVTVACRTDIDIDISYNRYTVDAKSILGVLGLDLTQLLTVTCHGYDKDFEEYLNHFSIAALVTTVEGQCSIAICGDLIISIYGVSSKCKFQ